MTGFAWREGFSEGIDLAVSALGGDFLFVLLVDFGDFFDVVFVGDLFELFFFSQGFGVVFGLVLFLVDVL